MNNRSVLIYILSDALFSGIPLLLLPLLSYYLSPSEYGAYTNFIVLVALYSVVIDFSSSGFYGICYHKKTKGIDNKRNYHSSFLMITVNCIVALIVTSLFIEKITYLSSINATYIFLGVITAYFMNVNMLYLTTLRFQNKVVLFGSIRVSQAVLHAIFALFFVIILHWSWSGRILAFLMPVFCLFIWVIYKNRNILTRKNFVFFRESYKDHFLFGLSLLPHALSSWIKTGLDRLLLSVMVGIGANGIYATSFQLAMVISLVGIGFNKAFSPLVYESLAKNQHSSINSIIKKFILYNAVLIIVTLILLVALVKYVFNEGYIGTIIHLPYLLLGQGFLNIYIIYSNFLFFHKKTLLLSSISVFSALIHVLLLFICLRLFGSIGASIAFLVSSILQMVITVSFVLKKRLIYGQINNK